MLEELTTATKTLGRKPSPAIAALDNDIRTRFKRRTDDLVSFLKVWIKLDESQAAMFGSRGQTGENYLQYALSQSDIDMALGLAQMCAYYAESTDAQKVVEFLNHIDSEGNDIWHYLADNLVAKEDDNSLEIAQILIQLEIDYCRKNDADESPLARLLIPKVKWPSVNSLMMAKQLTVEEMETSFSSKINENQAVKAEVMCNIFFSDLTENEGKLTSHILNGALSPKAEKHQRAKLAEVLFDYPGGKRQETVLLRIVETDHRDLFEKMMTFMLRCAEEATQQIAAQDLQQAKATQQILIYRRIARRNRVMQNVLQKCVAADKSNYIATALRMLGNEELVVIRKSARGQTEREVMVVDKNSAAPSNPGLSFLLQIDARGNLPFHNAVLTNRLDCLRKLVYGLSQGDLYAILYRIPNKYNLTVHDLLTAEQAHAKLTAEIKAQRMSVDDAKILMGAIKKADVRMVEFMQEVMKKAKDAIDRMGGPNGAKTSFDIRRIPTVQLALQNKALGSAQYVSGATAQAAPAAAPAAQAPSGVRR